MFDTVKAWCKGTDVLWMCHLLHWPYQFHNVVALLVVFVLAQDYRITLYLV